MNEKVVIGDRVKILELEYLDLPEDLGKEGRVVVDEPPLVVAPNDPIGPKYRIVTKWEKIMDEAPEIQNEYKIGDRVEIFGYSDNWDGPAVVTKNSAGRGWVNVQQLKGGAHAAVPATFTRENIRPLKDESVPEGTLDPSDPFEAALIDIVATNRRKRKDYTGVNDSPWSNFDAVERQTGGAFNSSVETLIAVKQARLAALQTREGGPVNESVEDTILDRAVYAVIALARSKYPEGVVK